MCCAGTNTKELVMEEQLAAFLEFLQTERSYSENTTAAYKNDLGQFVSFLTNNYSTIAS